MSALLEEFDVQRLYPKEEPRPSVHVLTSGFAVYLLTRGGVTTMYIEGEAVQQGLLGGKCCGTCP